jgi:imidazoleglycerol-phosphate dehydratase
VSRLKRTTNETTITVDCSIGDAPSSIRTGDKFFDHMLITLARYAGLSLQIEAAGDLQHHLLEDVAISLAMALRDEIPAHCARYGHAVIPMDDALVEVTIDAGGRPYYAGRLPSKLYDHVMRSFAIAADCTLHVRVLRGTDRHHIIEAAFKALGLSLRGATSEATSVFSTKGSVAIERGEIV